MGEDKIIARIQALIDKANASEFDHERDAFRDKAEELMAKWAIESWKLDEARAAKGEQRLQKIGKITIKTKGDFRQELGLMLGDLCHHMGVKAVITRKDALDPEEKVLYWELTCIGFEDDLSYLEILYVSLQLQILSKMYVKPDPKLGFGENIWMMHEAGYQWEFIRGEMNEASRENGGPGNWPIIPGHPHKSDGGRMLRACRAHAAKLEVPYHSVINQKKWRMSFVMAFCNRIVDRVAELRERVNRELGAEVVLFDRSKLVNDAVKEMFPALGSFKLARVEVHAGAAKRGRDAADQADIFKPGEHIGKTERKNLA